MYNLSNSCVYSIFKLGVPTRIVWILCNGRTSTTIVCGHAAETSNSICMPFIRIAFYKVVVVVVCLLQNVMETFMGLSES